MNTTLQQQFLAQIHELSGLLKYTEPTMGMLVKAIFIASARWRGGASFAYCEDYTFQRFSWRVKDDLAPKCRLDRAWQLLATSIPLGMHLFHELDVSAHDPDNQGQVDGFIARLAWTGFDPRFYMRQPATD